MNIKAILVTIIFIIAINHSGICETEKNPIKVLKKTTVFLGELDKQNKPIFYGTGFLVSIENIFHLITAKHVIMEVGPNNKFTGRQKDQNLCVFFNRKEGKIGWHTIKEIKSILKVDWIFDKNENVDIAIIPFAIDTVRDDLKVIPDEFFLTSESIAELYDVYFLSFQPGLQSIEEINPIIRTGVISLLNKDNSFYIDAFAFPGNSGSPVFLKPSAMRYDKPNVLSIGGDPLGNHFIGIIGEYLPYQEIAISTQTNRARVIFEENTGLSKVWSVEFINEIVESESFKTQLKSLLIKVK